MALHCCLQSIELYQILPLVYPVLIFVPPEIISNSWAFIMSDTALELMETNKWSEFPYCGLERFF